MPTNVNDVSNVQEFIPRLFWQDIPCFFSFDIAFSGSGLWLRALAPGSGSGLGLRLPCSVCTISVELNLFSSNCRGIDWFKENKSFV